MKRVSTSGIEGAILETLALTVRPANTIAGVGAILIDNQEGVYLYSLRSACPEQVLPSRR